MKRMKSIPAIKGRARNKRRSNGLTASLGLLIVLLGGSGCRLARPSLVQQSFSFLALPGPEGQHPATGQVLGIRRVEVKAPFDSQSLVYQTGQNSFEQDPYAQFLAPPAESIRSVLETYLRDTGSFTHISEAGSLLSPGLVLEVYIDQLYGDFRERQAPVAVLGARFVFFNRAQGQDRAALLDKEYSRRMPLKSRTARAVVAGWNEALRQIVTAALGDLGAIVPSSIAGEQETRKD